ncbi:hypothetical protein FF19_28100 [Klebsiella michiganensis]|nr:hypothetical protein FF19_28100 [Klebsiella michiganensis]
MVAEGFHHFQLMGDQHDGEVQLLVDIRQQAEHRGRGLGVEGAGGLIAQQHIRPRGQRAGDPHALFLPAGKL